MQQYVGYFIKARLDCSVSRLTFLIVYTSFNKILQNTGMFLFIRVSLYMHYSVLLVNDCNFSVDENVVNIAIDKIFFKC